jgi:hypothetical protein
MDPLYDFRTSRRDLGSGALTSAALRSQVAGGKHDYVTELSQSKTSDQHGLYKGHARRREMKQLKVELSENRPPEIISVHNHDTPDSWLEELKTKKYVLLNGTSYPREDIRGVEVYKPRSGSTNLQGI